LDSFAGRNLIQGEVEKQDIHAGFTQDPEILACGALVDQRVDLGK
jgi:hypothetical protein